MKKLAIAIVMIIGIASAVSAQPGTGIVATGGMQAVRAKLVQANGQPVVGVMGYLSVSGFTYDLRTATSDEQGAVTFLVPALPQKGQLIFQADPAAGNLQIEPLKPLTESIGSVVETTQPYRFLDSSVFYGTPDQRYLLDDYTRFATLEEVFREFVTEVRISKQNENFRLTVINKPFKTFFDNAPLILLDGVPVFDINRLMEIDPLKLKSIDVVARKYYLGRLLSYGIVSLFSFDGDLAGYSLPRQAVVIPIGK